LFSFFVDYHNKVAERGHNATNATFGRAPEGWNGTVINEMIAIENYWKEEFESGNLTLDQIIEHFSPNEIAYETISFYVLFFGKDGLFND